MAAPQPDPNQAHPLYSAGARKHYQASNSNEFEWKASVRVAHNKYDERRDKPSGVKYLNPTFGENNKRQPERKHSLAGEPTYKTNEDLPVGKQTFIMHNRKTQKEVEVHQSMGSKKRVATQFDCRNGLKMASLGDKEYKTPSY